MPVKSTRSGQGLVQRLGKVRSGNDDDTLGLLETVQFDQKLIERLLHVVLDVSKDSNLFPSAIPGPWQIASIRSHPARQ